jgi:hypothetical protein
MPTMLPCGRPAAPVLYSRLHILPMTTPSSASRWDVHELAFAAPGAAGSDPFCDVALHLEFQHGHRRLRVRGFYDGGDTWRARFMPDVEGEWTWRSESSLPALDGREGRFTVGPARPGNHGPVRVEARHHFQYADGTRHLSFGTTCYAWIHQSDERQEETLRTLANSPFNKLRMCVFPKWYDFNRGEPPRPVFALRPDGTPDFLRPNLEFFQLLDRRIAQLGEVGVEADLILFHPYDNWGFANMGAEADDAYLRYLVARVAAYRNVWWSFANEYDLMREKSTADWERLAALVQSEDPYGHLRSIHNCGPFYDHTRGWVTHVSAQGQDLCAMDRTEKFWRDYRKPVVWDEVGYEGTIEHGWGNLSPQELTRRWWEGTVRGGYVGHSETYDRPDGVLWWSHGGRLHGELPARVAFLRRIVEGCPGPGLEPLEGHWDHCAGGQAGRWILRYFGIKQPATRRLKLPPEGRFVAEVIDTWNMTITPLPGEHTGEVRVELPGRPFMAVLVRRVD